MNFTASFNEDGDGVIAYVNSKGEPVIIRQSDPGFTEALADLTSGREPEPLARISDEEVVAEVARVAAKLSNRISIDNDGVKFDGEPVHSTWADALVRYYDEGRPIDGLVAFYERLSANPSEDARNELWDWVTTQGLTVTGEGRIVGYKALREDFSSVTKGTNIVYVNGVAHTGHIPHNVGDVVSMLRSEVDESRQACSNGLHVGSYDYARGFGPLLTEVSFDPAHVVAVTGTWKLRTSEYRVLAVHVPEVDDLTHQEAEAVNDLVEDDEYAEAFSEVPQDWLDKLFSKLTRGRKARRVYTVSPLVNRDALSEVNLDREWEQADDEATDPEYDWDEVDEWLDDEDDQY